MGPVLARMARSKRLAASASVVMVPAMIYLVGMPTQVVIVNSSSLED